METIIYKMTDIKIFKLSPVCCASDDCWSLSAGDASVEFCIANEISETKLSSSMAAKVLGDKAGQILT